MLYKEPRQMCTASSQERFSLEQKSNQIAHRRGRGGGPEVQETEQCNFQSSHPSSLLRAGVKPVPVTAGPGQAAGSQLHVSHPSAALSRIPRAKPR